MADNLTTQGIAALKAGDRAIARQLLQAAVAQTPTDETAWLWLSGAVDTDQERVQCLQRVLEINPNSTIAQNGLASLKTSLERVETQQQLAGTGHAERITSDTGYIYVLINPSMEGLVKVGKTTRDPQDRVKELSAATGVPTPFYLAYKAYFQDCSRAEQYIHTRLEQKNFRVTQSREFFSAPLEEVIQTIIEAQRFREGNPEAEGGDFSITVSDNESTDVQPTSQPWRDVYEMAEAHYYGLGDTIQDKAEALKLYKQAAKLGCPAAFRKMGDIYHNEYSNSQKALEYFKQGVQMGDDRCWAEMGAVYFAEKHFENADKCWDKYFGSAHFRDNTDYDEPSSDRLWYSITYIRWMDAVKRRARHRDELSPIKRELIQRCNNLINSFRERGSNNLVNRCRKDLELVKKI